MSNLKKILALVLALVMSFSLVTVSNAAFADLKDTETVSENYYEAVKVLSDMGIFKGDNGNFKPKALITREEVAAIMYRVISGDVTDSYDGLYVEACDFEDGVATWAQGFVGYCANGGYVKGVGGKNFDPKGNITGTAVLAMALRAVGYDKKNEFTGPDWSDNVLARATELGVLENVKESAVTLGKPASRELVAELIFRTMVKAAKVTYTPAFDYQTTISTIYPTGRTIGLENFGLYRNLVETIDQWGTPAKVWHFDCGTLASVFPYPMVLETNEMTDECEIAHKLGDATYDIESAWIDGVEYAATHKAVTSNGVGTINKLRVNSMVGAQGRNTKIYNVLGDLRLVEINYYLAKVVSIVPGYTDKNGHPVPGYSVLQVYVPTVAADAAKDGILEDVNYTINLKTYETSYALNSYVLVTCSDASLAINFVEDVEAATVTPVGAVNGWFNRTKFATVGNTTLGATTYTDADKFVLEQGLGNGSRTYGGNWDAITDAHGNLIGMVPSAYNYLVVEAIRWEDSATVLGGHALANIVLADGTRLQNVVIGKVNNIAATNSLAVVGAPTAATVADDVLNNTAYYETITTYTVVDGVYYLDVDGDSPANYNDATGFHTAAVAANLKAKQTQFTVDMGTAATTDDQTFYMNDFTTYLVQEADGTYTKYVGKDNIPNMLDVELAYVNGADGYASLVVVFDYTSAAVVFDAYVDDVTSHKIVTLGGVEFFEFHVYKAGETTATKVYQLKTLGATLYDTNAAAAITDEGIYKFTMGPANTIVAAQLVVDELDGTDAGDNTAVQGNQLYWAANYVQLFQNGNTLVVDDAAALTGNEKSYGILTSTKVFVVEYNALRSEVIAITERTTDHLTLNELLVEGAYVVVATPAAASNAASYVYILQSSITPGLGGTPVTPSTTSTLTIAAAGANVTATYTNNSGATQTNVAVVWQYRVAGTENAWSTLETDTIASIADSASDASAVVTIPAGGSTLTYEVRAVVGTIVATSVLVIA